MNTLWKEFSKGLWKDLPPFKLVLGLCPVLAVTKTAYNGFGMGMAVIFVLALSNLLVSMLRRFIPSKVRIACFIVVAASLVVCVELLMQAYAYPLYLQLGIFVPRPLPPRTRCTSPWPTGWAWASATPSP
jgi:electron transport complex protein RnfE